MNWTWFGSADASTKHKCTRAVASFDSFTSSSTSIIIPFCDKKKLIKNSSVLTTCCNLASFFPSSIFSCPLFWAKYILFEVNLENHTEFCELHKTLEWEIFLQRSSRNVPKAFDNSNSLFLGQGGLGASSIKEKQQLLQKNCNLNKKTRGLVELFYWSTLTIMIDRLWFKIVLFFSWFS